MEDLRFELLSDTVYSLIPLLKKHFRPNFDILDEYGTLTKAYLPLLFALLAADKLIMSEAAKQVGLSKPHITLQVSRLVEEGLLERRPESEDRRLISISLTPKGSDLVHRLKGSIKEKAGRLFSGLPEETLERTVGALLTLKEVMAGADRQDRNRRKRAGSETPL